MLQPIEEAQIESIVGMITATISILSSWAIIFMINRTKDRFSTTNHRLLLALSISDVVASAAMALVSIPAPSNMENQWIAFGTTTTCEIQGFVFFVGAVTTPCYNAGICLYYLLIIRYHLTDGTIRKRVEPWLLLLPPLISTSVGIYLFAKDFYNPSLGCPCFIGEFPDNCSTSSSVECERGETVFEDFAVIFIYGLLFILVPLVIFLSMTHIYITVRKMERRITQQNPNSTPIPMSSEQAGRSNSMQYSRKAFNRGVAYSSAWLLAFIFPMVMFYQEIFGASGETSFAIRVLVALFNPLQGFFNFCVFITPKIRQKLKDKRKGVCNAFVSVLSYKYAPPENSPDDFTSSILRSSTQQQTSTTNTNSSPRTSDNSTTLAHDGSIVNSSQEVRPSPIRRSTNTSEESSHSRSTPVLVDDNVFDA